MSSPATPAPPQGHRRRTTDRRPLVIVVGIVTIAVLAQLFSWWDARDKDDGVTALRVDPLVEDARKRVEELLQPPGTMLPGSFDAETDPAAHAGAARLREIDARFRQGAAMLHAGRHEEAMAALHRVLELAPRLPEAHLNMGFALLGLEQPAEALDFFTAAADLKPMLTTSYYGMALAHEALGNLRMAVESMEAYLHLEKEESYFTRRAASAVWEWRARLEGVPMTPEEVEEAMRQAEEAAQPGEEDDAGEAPE